MAVNLAGMATYLGIGASDALYPQLQGVLDATVELVESKVGQRGATPTLTVRPDGRCLVLPAVHLASVDTITDPAGNTVALTDCDVDEVAGVVVLPSVVTSGYQRAYTVEVTTATSAAVDEATLIIGKHLWESRRGNRGQAANAYAQDMDVVPVGFAIPRRAAELLTPLMAPGAA